MAKKIRFKFAFRGLTQKKQIYTRAIRSLKQETQDDVDYYGRRISNIMKEHAPKDTQNLQNSIRRIPINKSLVRVTLQPNVVYWSYQEFGLPSPKWVSVEDKPALQGWLKRHPNVKTRKFIGKDGDGVEVLKIGGRNTHLGTKNVFVKPARDFIENTHDKTLALTAEYFRKLLPKQR